MATEVRMKQQLDSDELADSGEPDLVKLCGCMSPCSKTAQGSFLSSHNICCRLAHHCRGTVLGMLVTFLDSPPAGARPMIKELPRV